MNEWWFFYCQCIAFSLGALSVHTVTACDQIRKLDMQWVGASVLVYIVTIGLAPLFALVMLWNAAGAIHDLIERGHK